MSHPQYCLGQHQYFFQYHQRYSTTQCATHASTSTSLTQVITPPTLALDPRKHVSQVSKPAKQARHPRHPRQPPPTQARHPHHIRQHIQHAISRTPIRAIRHLYIFKLRQGLNQIHLFLSYVHFHQVIACYDLACLIECIHIIIKDSKLKVTKKNFLIFSMLRNMYLKHELPENTPFLKQVPHFRRDMSNMSWYEAKRSMKFNNNSHNLPMLVYTW